MIRPLIRQQPVRPLPGISEPTSPPAIRPLVITGDDQLLDDVLRLAAAAGSEVEVAHDLAAGRSRWHAAPVILIGHDLAAALASVPPSRRDRVFVVGQSLAADEHSNSSLWRYALDLGAERVCLLPADETWLTERLADAAEGELAEAQVVGVIGGRGGAGASVFATALALAGTRQGWTTMLVDLDLWGGGLDLVLGAEDSAGLRWPDLADTRGRLGGRALLAELPARRDLTVVSGDRGDLTAIPVEAARAVLSAGRRASDLVVIDLPRQLDVAGDEALAGCSCVAVVVPTEVRAVAAAARVVAAATTRAADVRLVTRRTSASGVTAADVSAALDLPLSVEIPTEPRIADKLDRGDPPGLDGSGPLSAACDQFLDDMRADSLPARAA